MKMSAGSYVLLLVITGSFLGFFCEAVREEGFLNVVRYFSPILVPLLFVCLKVEVVEEKDTAQQAEGKPLHRTIRATCSCGWFDVAPELKTLGHELKWLESRHATVAPMCRRDLYVKMDD